MKKITLLYLFTFCFSIAPVMSAQENNSYLDELKNFKKSRENEFLLSDNVHLGAALIYKELELYKHYNSAERLSFFFITLFNPFLVTSKTMPRLFSFIDTLCKKNKLPTPAIFISQEKNFMNAAASKIFGEIGGIIIGQKMIYETTHEELEAILAHEIGHLKFNHTSRKLKMEIYSLIALAGLTYAGLRWYKSIMGYQQHPYTQKDYFTMIGIPLWFSEFIPKLIINKKFEKEADTFACEQGHAPGLIKFFENCLAREKSEDHDFEFVKEKMQEIESTLDSNDYAHLKFVFSINKRLHSLQKFLRSVYGTTFLGDHPTHEARIEAAQNYLNAQSDWNLA